jgi:gliding motility-associated-like protein
VSLTQIFKPDLNPVRDTFLCDGFPIAVHYPVVNGVNYIWSNNMGGGSMFVDKPGNYWLRAYNNCGDTTVNFKVKDSSCKCSMYVPNTFTPNGDGRNDGFIISASCDLLDYNIVVFNRWGQKVFESNEVGAAWNGMHNNQPVPNGIYIYKIKTHFGYARFTALREFEGFVRVLR